MPPKNCGAVQGRLFHPMSDRRENCRWRRRPQGDDDTHAAGEDLEDDDDEDAHVSALLRLAMAQDPTDLKTMRHTTTTFLPHRFYPIYATLSMIQLKKKTGFPPADLLLLHIIAHR